jgi:uncharacterized cupin superfamily protein
LVSSRAFERQGVESEGSVTIAVEDGDEVGIYAGEPFVIPQGLRCNWSEAGSVRQFYEIFELRV